MRFSVYVPLIVAAFLAGFSPVLATRLPPAVAARVLTVVAVVAALSSTWGTVLLSMTLLGQEPAVASRTHWSVRILHAADPVPRLVAALAVAALAAVCVRLVLEIMRQTRGRRAARTLCAGAATELMVFHDDHPHAFAVPGHQAHIVVSTGMLSALSHQERRVLFAHERSHLAHRHDRYLLLTALAAALNPMLTRHQRDVAYVCERWADEDASVVVASRVLAARALARAAVAALSPTNPHLAFERLRVPHRLAALRAEQPRPRPLLALTYAFCAALPVVATIDATLALARLLNPHI